LMVLDLGFKDFFVQQVPIFMRRLCYQASTGKGLLN
jgi:hypothetical protein